MKGRRRQRKPRPAGTSAEDTFLRVQQERRRKDMEWRGPLGFLRVYLRELRRYLVAGLLVWIPLIVTAWVTYWVVTNIGLTINDYLAWVVAQVAALGERVSWLSWLAAFEYKAYIGFLLTILIFLSTGFFARYLVTRQVISVLERLVSVIPVVNRVYTASQQIRDVFVSRDGGVFEEVVLVEYPRKGVFVLAFVTSREQDIVQQTAEADLTAVFVPTTPNPTSGFLLYVPTEELRPVAMNVEDAMKMIVSGGAYLPGRPKDADALARLHRAEDEG